MIGRYSAIFIALALAFPVSGYSQSIIPNPGGPAGFMAYGPFGGSNPSPGGLTIVPGTVVVPGISGAANTGSIPLPGTTGAPSVPSITEPLDNGGLYPPAFYPFVPTSGVSQSTLPQNGRMLDLPVILAPSINDSVPNCLNYPTPVNDCGR